MPEGEMNGVHSCRDCASEACDREVPDATSPKPVVCEAKQKRRIESSDTSIESRTAKKIRLMRELNELEKEEEEQDELDALERKIAEAHKRIQEKIAPKTARETSSGQEEKLQSPLSTTTSSKIDVHSTTGTNGPISPVSEITAGRSTGGMKAHPLVDSEMEQGNTSHSTIQTTGFFPPRGFGRLEFYEEVGEDMLRAFKDLDISELRHLIANEESAPRDTMEATSATYIQYSIFLKTGEMTNLERAIQHAEEQMPISDSSLEYHNRLRDLIVMLIKKYQLTNLVSDLQTAIYRAQDMVIAMPLHQFGRQAQIRDFIRMMFTKFERTQSQEDLDEATIIAQQLDASMSIDDSDGKGIRVEFRLPHQAPVRGLNSAAGFAETIATQIYHRIELLADKYLRTDKLEYLDEAITAVEQVMHQMGVGHPLVVTALRVLENCLEGCRDTFIHQKELILCLHRIFHIAHQVVDAIPKNDPNRAIASNLFATFFRIIHDQMDENGQLDRALEITSRAVEGTPEDREDVQSILEHWVKNRTRRTSSIIDCNRAVDVASRLVNATPKDDTSRIFALIWLERCLSVRHDRTGSIDDLNNAIEIVNQLISDLPEGHPERSLMLKELSNYLDDRFKRTGSIDDVNRAIEITKHISDTTPEDRAGTLNTLGSLFHAKFNRFGLLDDLSCAVTAFSEAFDIKSEAYSVSASNLASALCQRYMHLGSVDDLDRAISIATRVINLPGSRSFRAFDLTHLALMHANRFDVRGSEDDLSRAIDLASKALDGTPMDHPNRAIQLGNLATIFEKCAIKGRDPLANLVRAASSWEKAWDCRGSFPAYRIKAARKAAMLHATTFDWECSSYLLQEAVKILPDVSPRWLKHADKQHTLADFAGLASAAAATALNAGRDTYDSLKLLELGRGVIAHLLIETRGDISDLEQKHPELAAKFISLRDELDSQEDSISSSNSIKNFSVQESITKQRREAEEELNKLRSTIRAQPGFENFHLPLTVDEMKAAADPDPLVVINLSEWRCDAFLIDREQIKLLELPGLTLEEVRARTEGLRRFRQSAIISPLLEWLWDAIAHPVLDALGFREPVSNANWPRVWWIPTGLLTQLPLHAAGYHTRGRGETVLDRVISSYASSIKELIHGRRFKVRQTTGQVPDKALLVAMRETPNLSLNQILKFATDEIEMVEEICPALGLQPIKPSLRKDDVLEALQTCRIFHFAGHGHSDPVDPSRSSLLLKDWETNPLSVGELRDRKLQKNPPFLGFLSACSTGANEAEELVDEGINLINAFQLAGFRHVVGTLWEVSDSHCVDVAKVLYETIRDEGMTDVAVCRGLHFAVRALRDKEISEAGRRRDATMMSEADDTQDGIVSHWVPYVHFGV
ncbi:CHAT domain-containing protein [Nemania abortiva]|nr:CHAT domain-containing protein [Nemania abortiva]